MRQGSGAKEIEGRGCAPAEEVGSCCAVETQTFLIEHSQNLEIWFKFSPHKIGSISKKDDCAKKPKIYNNNTSYAHETLDL